MVPTSQCKDTTHFRSPFLTLTLLFCGDQGTECGGIRLRCIGGELCSLVQVRETMVGRTSVLAGPSGVGKSSIINALRAEAFDPQQLSRLADFERKMEEEESFWRAYHEGPLHRDESEHEATASGKEAEVVHSGSACLSCVFTLRWVWGRGGRGDSSSSLGVSCSGESQSPACIE